MCFLIFLLFGYILENNYRIFHISLSTLLKFFNILNMNLEVLKCAYNEEALLFELLLNRAF